MARFYCRWRKVLICVCTPCILLLLLFIYVTVMLCFSMSGTAGSPGTVVHIQDNSHFVATGILTNTIFAALPKTFWEVRSSKDGIWNQVQLALDRRFNPILRPNSFKTGFEDSASHESLLRQSFSEGINTDNKQEDFKKLPRQLQDFVSHMQRRDYPIIFQPEGVCGAGAQDEKEPPLLLLAIKTTALNFKNRRAIRQTWGREGWIAGQKSSIKGGEEGGGYVRRVFLLGKEDSEISDMDLSELLQMESIHYGDILQWDFRDTFFNLTLKDVLFWSWFSRFCSQTRFVFKGDDDVFVNTPKMIAYLQDQPQAQTTIKDFMVGDVIGAATPYRINESKYFIPDNFYKGFYPTYAGGGGVVYSGLLTQRLHDVSQRVHLFPIDDVYVGMCMTRLNAHPIHHSAFLTFDFPKKEEEELCSYHTILMVHKRSPSQLVKLWDQMKKTQAQCWDVPLRESDEVKHPKKLI